MRLDTDIVRRRLDELADETSGGELPRSFAMWVLAARVRRALEILEEFYREECSSLPQKPTAITRVLGLFGMEELSKIEYMIASAKVWARIRESYRHARMHTLHLYELFRDHFNWSRHP